MIVTAKVDVVENEEVVTREKDFDVEVRENGKLYSEELVVWIVKQDNRIGNLFTVKINNKDYTYSI